MSRKHMREVTDIFVSLGIQVWVDQGTLLGAVRDNGFIPWDWDIDLSAWYGDWIYDARIKKAFESAGFDFIHLKICQSLRIEPKEKYIGWRQIDVHMYKVEGDNACTYFGEFNPNGLVQAGIFKVVRQLDIWQRAVACEAPSLKLLLKQPELAEGQYVNAPVSGFKKILYRILKGVKHRIFMVRFNSCIYLRKVQTPIHYYQDLKALVLLGNQYSAPANIETYLQFKYGDSWQTPIQDYDWRNDGSVQPCANIKFGYSQ